MIVNKRNWKFFFFFILFLILIFFGYEYYSEDDLDKFFWFRVFVLSLVCVLVIYRNDLKINYQGLFKEEKNTDFQNNDINYVEGAYEEE